MTPRNDKAPHVGADWGAIAGYGLPFLGLIIFVTIMMLTGKT
jgi:hypothetical protein